MAYGHSTGILRHSKKGAMLHEHPLKIFKHTKKIVWLLIFPILRFARDFSLDFEQFTQWLEGIWFDVILLFIVLAFGYFRWLFTWIRLGRNHVRVMSGFFVKKRIEIPYKNISTVTAQYSFFFRPLKAVRVNIDTGAGALDTTDMSILIKNNDLKKIQRKLPNINNKEKKSFKFKPKWYHITFFSFIFSSSLSGALILTALIFNAGTIATDLMREELPQMYQIADNVTENVSEIAPFDISTEITVLATIVLGTWLLSFVVNLFRYMNFIMKKDTHVMKIMTGVFTKRIFNIIPNKINYLDLRQSFISKLCRISSLNISCSGYGRNQLPVLLPVLNRKQADEALEMLGFKKYLVKRKVKPEKITLMSYIWLPLFIAGLIIAASMIFLHFFPNMISKSTVYFAVLILTVPFIWRAIVKFYAYLTTGITVEEDFCCIRYSRFYAFHTILADKNKLVKVQIFQDIFDKKVNRCRLDFYFSSEKPRAHKVKGLRVADAQKILEQFEVFKENEDVNEL